ncbi:type II toxin-antitoxin system Phd/YefM family antitoxin [Parapedobacter sp. DT-150]|uniref:type II toxin-antitoxin system Phd/YefM family antitoxin n=1 Tax=Parapedobacter sp. DT-150 TaxID=3396162 RepID=UPI003F1BEB0A
MKVVNYSDFRNNLKSNLNVVNEDREIVIVSRTKGKSVVVMDLEEYNGIQETMYLMGTPANRHRLAEAIDEMNGGKYAAHPLIEE